MVVTLVNELVGMDVVVVGVVVELVLVGVVVELVVVELVVVGIFITLSNDSILSSGFGGLLVVAGAKS